MRVLRVLLWLLPCEFRLEYGSEVLATAQDQWLEAGPDMGAWGRLRFWLRQWLAAVRVGVSLRKGRGIIGGADERVHRKEDVMDGVWKDVRHSARALVARPGFTLVAVLTLGLGVGATTAMFSAVNAVLIRELPYQGADDIVVLRRTDIRDGSLEDGVSAANMRDVAIASQTLSQVSVAEPYSFDLIVDGRAISLRGWRVSEGFFEAIGGHTRLGRTFLPEEFVAGGERVVLLSHQTWLTRLGGDPDIVGRDLVLDGSAHTVVGVLGPDFKYPSASEIWAPRPPQPWDDGARASAYMDGVARLEPGAALGQAQTELDRVASELSQIHPSSNAHMGLQLTPLRQHLFGDVRPALMLLLGAVALVLLIAAANVAGLQLARGSGRSREYALREALGASSGRILRLVAIEGLLLAVVGGALGIGLAYVVVELIKMLAPTHLPRFDELSIDGPVLGVALMAAMGSALMAGIAPALRASRTDLRRALVEGSRGSTKGPRAASLRDRLVVAEIALALVLTIGAGLLVKSFDRLLDNELGFDPEGRLAVQVFAYTDQGEVNQDFFLRSVEEIEGLPGVEGVALTTNIPLADDASISSITSTVRFTVDDRAAPAEGDEPVASVIAITGSYAEVMGIEVKVGRTFSTQDHLQSPPVVMINEAFARRHFPDQNPVNEFITLHRGSSRSREIVGVIADVRPEGFESEPRTEVYLPLSQAPSGSITFVVKAAGDPVLLIKAVQEAIWATEPSQAIWASRPMHELLGDWTRQRRFNTALLVAFAALALSLTAIGVYGLMSFSVEQRVNEMGIRRALGGNASDIMGMVLRRGLELALSGAALGLMGSVVLTRLLRGMLFDVDPFDPLTFASLSVFVVAVSMVAAFLPARRATRVDPMVALRAE